MRKNKKSGKSVLTYDISGAILSAKYGDGYLDLMPDLVASRMAAFGINTYGAWSNMNIATNPNVRRIPYTVILHPWSKPLIDDLYDPFEPGFRDSIAQGVRSLAGEGKPAGDPWCLGVFIHNELNWPEGDGIGRFTLQAPGTQAAKVAMVAALKQKHGDIAALNRAWETGYPNWEGLMAARQAPGKTNAALAADLRDFGRRFAEEYYRVCLEQMRAHAPHKLYLGSRIHNIRDDVVAACSKFADVVSFNQYGLSVAGLRLRAGSTDKPVMIGEFSFPRSGRCMEADGGFMREVFDPDYQPRAYRHYLDGALENPAIVGAHIFRWQEWIIDRADTPHWNLVEELLGFSTGMHAYRLGGATAR